MNFIKINRAGLLLIVTSLVYMSCTKQKPAIADNDSNFSNSATVQVIDVTLKSTKNFLYVDNALVTGAVFAYQGVSPSTGPGYRLAAGSRSFVIKDTTATTTQPPLSFTQNLEAGKSYTIFMYDTLNSPKQLTVVNNIEIPTDTTSRLRFANFLYNTTAIPAVDVYSFRRGMSTPVFSNVATNTVTNFIPYASILTDTLYVYPTGSTAASSLIVKQVVNSLTPSRSYTSVANGSYRGTKAITTFATY